MIPSWQELLDRGLYAKEAAAIRGTRHQAPLDWARRHKKKWPDGRAHINECPCVVKGRAFPSIKAAAKHFKVDPSTIGRLLNKHGHADFVGRGQKGVPKRTKPGNSQPLILGGVRYASQSDAAREFGVSPQTLGNWIHNRHHDSREKLMGAILRRDAKIAKQRLIDLDAHLDGRRKVAA